MKRIVISSFLLVVATVGVVGAQQPRSGDVASFEFLRQLSARDVDIEGEPLFEEFEHPDARYAVRVFELTFQTRDADGTPVEAFASLHVPVLSTRQELPVLAFGSGTTGIGDQCAPSLEQPEVIRWGWYRQNMNAYAGQGIVTIFPDYIGFNDPGIPQRYFSKAAEGHLMLDALRAVRTVFREYRNELDTEAVLSGRSVTAGYSQGGHAALAAADMNARYAPDVTLDGAIGFGSTNNVETLMREAGYYAPYILYSYEHIYGNDVVNPDNILQENWSDSLEEDVLRMCVHEFQYYYPYETAPLYTKRFQAALTNDRLDQEFPAIKAILDENVSGLDGHGKPVLMIQGNQDIIVSNQAQRAYVARLRASGSEVELVEMEGVRHRHTRPAGFSRSVDFVLAVTEAR